jgi:hypothetical protein
MVRLEDFHEALECYQRIIAMLKENKAEINANGNLSFPSPAHFDHAANAIKLMAGRILMALTDGA